MIAESIPLTVEELAKQVELLQGSFDLWWWVWTLAIGWLLLKTSTILVEMGAAPRENLDGRISSLSARLGEVERKIKDWERVLPR
jgi:hypothetical protein